MKSWILLLIILLPMILATFQYALSKIMNKSIQIIGVMSALIDLVLLLLLMFNVPLSFQYSYFSFTSDGFRSIMAFICCLMWLFTLIFSLQYMKHYENLNRYYFFNLLTFSATLGVFLSASLLTTFIFFEIMSFSSYVLIIHDQKEESMSAGKVYLIITIISGMILLFGLMLLYGEFKTLDFDNLYTLCQNHHSNKVTFGGICLLIGFGAKAGLFPLHIWLAKAHPVAPAPASALLSGILTKCGVFGIIICVCRIFIFNTIFSYVLLILALISMLLGSIFAVLSINLKETLAYSSIAQIGFILIALALSKYSSLAIEATLFHMINHALFKLSLFMLAGVVFMNVFELNLNSIKGFGRKKIILKICFLISSLAIMGFPLLNGYLSKTLIHEAIIAFKVVQPVFATIIEWCFIFAGGCSIAYMLKLFVCLFVEKNNDENLQKQFDKTKKYMNFNSSCVIIFSSVLLCLLGICIPLSNQILQFGSDFFKIGELQMISYFTWNCLRGFLLTLVVGICIYFVFVRLIMLQKTTNGKKKYVYVYPSSLNLIDCFYKPLIFSPFKKNQLNLISYGVLLLVRVLFEWFDGCLYFLKMSVFKQYKYQYDSAPLSYRLTLWINRYYHKNQSNYSYQLYQKYIVSKDVVDTLNATFSFDFLMACIGIVVVLLLMIFLR